MAFAPLIMLAVTAVSAFAQAGMQSAAANSQAKAQIAESTRQQTEVNKQANQQKGDRARQADEQLGTLRVLAGERGQGGTSTYFRQTLDLGYTEGLDLSRIEANRQAKVDSLQADKKNAASQAKSTSNNAFICAGLSTVGAGLQIGGQMYQQQTIEDAYRNQVQ
jgi:hypothetical protein